MDSRLPSHVDDKVSQSHENVRKFAKCIVDARAGDAASEKFLRVRLETTAKSMPLELVLLLSEMIGGYRRDELREDAGRN